MSEQLRFKTIENVVPEVWHEVPFQDNLDPDFPGYCLPSNVHSIIAFYMPKYKLQKRHVGRLCGYNPQTGTRKLKSLLHLADHGYDVAAIEDLGVENIAEITVEDYLQHLRTDFPNQEFHYNPEALAGVESEVEYIRQYAARRLPFKNRRGTTEDMRGFLRSDYLVRTSVGSRLLFPENDLSDVPYLGHSILGVGYGRDRETHGQGLIFHNSADISIPNQFLPWGKLLRAMDAFSTSRPVNAYRYTPTPDIPYRPVRPANVRHLQNMPNSPEMQDNNLATCMAAIMQTAVHFLRPEKVESFLAIRSNYLAEATPATSPLKPDVVCLQELLAVTDPELGVQVTWHEDADEERHRELMDLVHFQRCVKQGMQFKDTPGSFTLLRQKLYSASMAIMIVDSNKLQPEIEQDPGTKAEIEPILIVGSAKGSDPLTGYLCEGFLFHSMSGNSILQFLPCKYIKQARDGVSKRRQIIMLEKDQFANDLRDIVWLAGRIAGREINLDALRKME